jgi:hypothetical protein
MGVTPANGDLLHNARDGLRGRYWLGADEGDEATRHLVELLKARLLQSVPTKGLNVESLTLGCDAIARALDFPSTKLWIDEKQRTSDGQLLDVARWAINETEDKNPHLWRWTPQATILEVKAAWITPDDSEWVSEVKKERAKQIHRWGYS